MPAAARRPVAAARRGAPVGKPAIPDLPWVEMGANGEAVTTVQYLLRHRGADIVVDGDFGEQTDDRVRAFQGANGLVVDGVVGAQTWPALFVTVKRGDQGDAVRAAQSQLASRGIDVAVDGVFGPQTDEKVRAFQHAKGIAADGIVGPLTWTALVAAN
jgi:peptidoglycan hydrolase-like protein with peptidoglycan-binding domain